MYVPGSLAVANAAGKFRDESLDVGVLGTPIYSNAGGVYDFAIRNSKALVLRGTAEYLALNSAAVALPSGMVADVHAEWTEE